VLGLTLLCVVQYLIMSVFSFRRGVLQVGYSPLSLYYTLTLGIDLKDYTLRKDQLIPKFYPHLFFLLILRNP
jgi:hypothetical protein